MLGRAVEVVAFFRRGGVDMDFVVQASRLQQTRLRGELIIRCSRDGRTTIRDVRTTKVAAAINYATR